MLRLENVRARVEGKEVLKGISLSLREGEVLYVLGPNGCGKTSLLRAIAGYPGYEVEGRVEFYGEDISSLPAEQRAARGVGIAHQIPPRLSNVNTGALLEQMCQKFGCNSVREVAELLNIKHLLGRPFGKGFSGGELKRVELATLLLQRPKLALIDEPDSGVDVDSVAVIAEGIRRLLSSSTRGAIIVTHSGLMARLVEPSGVCIMLDGRLVKCGGRELLEEAMGRGFRALVGGS
ncbi:MAG: ATP-binding cassette domain-containing protein [Acidilobaceae archaeon]|nr:ATP-binding cassette domain-containing protein [Acidilobaceae archaeon]